MAEEEVAEAAEETFEDLLEEALDLPGADRPPLDVREISLDDIGEVGNVRHAYHGIEGLAETMHMQGQLQPCVVRPAPEDSEHGKPWELVCGFRRKRAAEFLREREVEGWDSLRCEVRDIPDDKRIRQTIVENFQRENLSPVAEARAMLQLRQSADPPLTNAQVARELGCDPSHVSHRIKLLQLAPPEPEKREAPPAPEKAPPAPESAEENLETKEGSSIPTGALAAAPGSEPAEAVGVAAEITTPESVLDSDSGASQPPEGSALGSDAPEVAESPPVAEKPALDILDMVDRGEISASTAEVIVSLPDQEQREKLALLAKRGNWSTKKAARWARDVQKNKIKDAGPEFGEIEMVRIEDVQDLPHLVVKPDLSDKEIKKILLYALLRNGMDREMLDYLDEEMNTPYEELWDYVDGLDDDDVEVFLERMARRYISAAHRWFSLEKSLKDHFAIPEEADPEEREEAESLASSLPQATSSKHDGGGLLDDILESAKKNSEEA